MVALRYWPVNEEVSMDTLALAAGLTLGSGGVVGCRVVLVATSGMDT